MRPSTTSPENLSFFFTTTPAVTPTPTESRVAVLSINLDKAKAVISVSKMLQINATVNPSNASNKGINWSSSNIKIAIVSSNGMVTAKARGTAIIIATTVDGGKIALCNITVTQPVLSVKLNKITLTINKNKTYKLIATVNPTNASNKKVTWKSRNKAIATVSSTGIVKGIKKGTTYIYVYTVDGKKTAKCKVTIK